MLFALFWGLLLLVAFLAGSGPLGRALADLRPRCALLLVVGIALFVRMVPNFVLPGGAGYDIESYRLVAESLRAGEDVYRNPATSDRHPYLPLQMYWMALASWLSDQAGVSFVKVVRLAPILADCGIALALFSFLKERASPAVAHQGALYYALSPVSVFVSGYHGQFDAIPLLFLVLAVVSDRRSTHRSAAYLGAGILSKSWPVLALPSFWCKLRSWRKRVSFAFVVALIPAVGLALYSVLLGSRIDNVVQTAISYDWGVGAWGYTYILRLLGILWPSLRFLFTLAVRGGRYVTLALLAIVWLLGARRETLPEGILTVFVTFFAVTHAFSVQYLVWLIPLAILASERRWLTRYTLAATSYMILVYTTLILELRITTLLPWPQADWFLIMPAGLPAWLVTLAWAVQRWRASVRWPIVDLRLEG